LYIFAYTTAGGYRTSRDVPSQWDGQNFYPPTAPTFFNRS